MAKSKRMHKARSKRSAHTHTHRKQRGKGFWDKAKSFVSDHWKKAAVGAAAVGGLALTANSFRKKNNNDRSDWANSIDAVARSSHGTHA